MPATKHLTRLLQGWAKNDPMKVSVTVFDSRGVRLGYVDSTGTFYNTRFDDAFIACQLVNATINRNILRYDRRGRLSMLATAHHIRNRSK